MTAPHLLANVAGGAACAEAFDDLAESAAFPAEAAVVAGATTERRREFGTVRRCARTALRRISAPEVALLPDRDGAPLWPVGVVGSMTHCRGYRGAAVARTSDLLAIGIDAEPHAPLPGGTADLVLREEERRWIALAPADVHWDRVVFCAKEAAYKAWFPLTRRCFEFDELSATVRPDGTFRVRPAVPGGPEPLDGRWLVGRGLVVAATVVHREGWR